MTYKELIEECFYKLPTDTCSSCKYQKECYAFENKTDCCIPRELYPVLDFDSESLVHILMRLSNFDAEIEVE